MLQSLFLRIHICDPPSPTIVYIFTTLLWTLWNLNLTCSSEKVEKITWNKLTKWEILSLDSILNITKALEASDHIL